LQGFADVEKVLLQNRLGGHQSRDCCRCSEPGEFVLDSWVDKGSTATGKIINAPLFARMIDFPSSGDNSLRRMYLAKTHHGICIGEIIVPFSLDISAGASGPF